MRLFLLALLLVFAACALVAQTARQDELDDASIADAARILESAIRSAVSQAGGDLEKQHVHLVLAFSTGHFNKDPLGAQAARQIAWLVVKDLLVAGDRVSVFAWEMNLWDHLQGKDNSLVLSGSDEKSKQPVQDLFPNTVQDGSQGGHDTERAIVEITRRLGDARDAVIVLITNDAQSVAPKGLQTIGADNPEYQQVLQTWQRLPQVNERGASVELPFFIHKAVGGMQPRRLDAVILVPQSYGAAGMVQASRTQLLTPPVTGGQDDKGTTSTETAEKTDGKGGTGSGFLRVVIPLLIIAPIVVLVWYIITVLPNGVPDPKIEGTTIPFAQLKPGEVICTVVGQGYSDPVAGRKVEVSRIPPLLVAQLKKEGKKQIRVQDKEFKLVGINNRPDAVRATLSPNSFYTLTFAGDVPQGAGLPPRRVEVQIHVDWRPEKKEGGQ
ncbi:MAG: hypothetical protein QXI42_12255 [Thermoproteota archaeon]